MSLCNGSEELISNYLSLLRPSQGSEKAAVRENMTSLSGTIFQHWCHFQPIPELGHFLIGTLLIFICVASIAGNSLVVLVFTRFRRMRSPANTLIVNLAVSDLMNGFLHPMAAYSSFSEKWMFGRNGCQMYAFLCGLFGLVSIVTLSAIALERCLVISVKPWYGDIKLTNNKIKYVIVTIWIYCAITVMPPFLGWGDFVPEAFLTSCSFDYLTRTLCNRTYFIYLFTLGFFIPVLIIVVCYTFIIRTIYINERNMKKNNVKKVYTRHIPRRRNDYKAAEMVLVVIVMFLLSWTPYSVIATIGQFGDPEILTPWVSVLPSLFAKMSTIYNPAIYGLSHRHFRATLRRIFQRHRSPTSTDKVLTRFSKTSIHLRNRPSCPCIPNAPISEDMERNSLSTAGGKCYIGATIPDAPRCYKPIFSAPDMPCHTPSSTENKTNSVPNQVFLTVTKSHGNRALVRKLLFRSDSSLYQKYQTILENDQIIRLWTGTCFCCDETVRNSTNSTEIRIERSLKPTSSSLEVGPLTSTSFSVASRTSGSSRGSFHLNSAKRKLHRRDSSGSILYGV